MQEVFKNIVEKLEEIRVKKTCNKEKCDTKELCRICVVDDAIEIVKQTAEEYVTDTNVGNNGWIPVSERLPEEVGHLADGKKKKQYLVMTRNGRYEVAEWLEVYDEPFWCSHYAAEVKDIVYWKPLEPYQQNGE